MPKSLSPHTEDRVSSLGLHRFADDFYQAYKLTTIRNNNLIQVRSYLLCHSFELSMKSVLREAGYTVTQLLNLGHDLEKIALVIQKHPKIKVRWEKKDLELIRLANFHYVTKEMEYFTRGAKTLVNPEDFSTFLEIWLRLSHVTIMEIAKSENRTYPCI